MPTAAAPIYRPRHPERTGLCRLFDQHFDRFVREYDERFDYRHGPLRPNVQRVVEPYLDCGRMHGGFARLRCFPSSPRRLHRARGSARSF